MDTMRSEKAVLLTAIDRDLKKDKASVTGQNRSKIREAFEKRSERLKKLITKGDFVKDDQINNYISRVFDTIKKDNPQHKYPSRVLVSRNALPNAYCTGEGTIIITLGLLNRITSESQLAFILAHESAHHILNHVNNNIISSYDKNNKVKIEDDNASASEYLDLLKSTVYSNYTASRKLEISADSLGALLVYKTSYDWREYQQVLTMLDSADYPKHNLDPSLKDIFNFKEYPFKEKWLNKPESTFSGKRSSFIYDIDSLKTHPDISKRIASLDQIYFQTDYDTNSNVTDHDVEIGMIANRIDLELINSTYQYNDYARCIYLTMQMLKKYPENSYLKTMLAQIFLKLYEARRDHKFGKYVPVANNYPNQMEDVYIFLNNLRMVELGKLTFNYINRESTFDESIEEHYHILWKVSDYLGKTEVKEAVSAAYLKKYPSGSYTNSISK